MFPLLPVPEYRAIPERERILPIEDRVDARRAIRRDAERRRLDRCREDGERALARLDREEAILERIY